MNIIVKSLSTLMVIIMPLSTYAVTSTGTETLRVGSYKSFVWHSDSFSGTHTRNFDEKQLNIQIKATNGGFDTAVQRGLPATRVDQLEGTFCVNFDYVINATAGSDKYDTYYVGPKIGVTQTPTWSENGWYENYIVENSSRSPAAWDSYFRDRGGKYLGITTHDGSDYKHYFTSQDTWSQYWAIRQNFRNSGTVSIAPIYQFWRSKGMSNGYLLDVRLNLETSGDVAGTFTIRNYNIASSFASSCSTLPPSDVQPPSNLRVVSQ